MLSGVEVAGREAGGVMLSISGLKNFYYLLTLHEGADVKGMRLGAVIRTVLVIRNIIYGV